MMDKQHLIALNWPPALIKALDDPFEYQLTLTNGETFTFEQAEYVNSDFIRIRWYNQGIKYPRGIEIRVSQIATIVDAPNGI